jgi:2-polyprenyl-6-methoxyphenol hydroxylase-like FAD-dependent oxidoreductase
MVIYLLNIHTLFAHLLFIYLLFIYLFINFESSWRLLSRQDAADIADAIAASSDDTLVANLEEVGRERLERGAVLQRLSQGVATAALGGGSRVAMACRNAVLPLMAKSALKKYEPLLL